MSFLVMSFMSKIFIVVVVKSLNHICLFVTPWIVASQALLSMRFPKQGYWSGLPFPPPGDFSNPGLNPRLLHEGVDRGDDQG